MQGLEQYAELIARAEATAASNPRLYKLQLSLLAAVGIGYVVLLLLIAVGCGLFMVGLLLTAKSMTLLKLALLPLGLAYLLARALWFRLPAPQGRRVTAAEVPALFAEIEQVRSTVNAEAVHEVLLTPDFNAAVVQIPRLGMLGWPKRYLIIGLPLLACLPPYQVRAVLAHEFGHLAQNHAHFGNWIYRIRETWYRILEGLPPRRSALTRVLTRFFDWYAPQFNAYSFVLARANEYEADRESARVTSRADAGDALAAVYARSEYIETRIWGEFYARAQMQADPPPQPFTDYVAALRAIPAQHSAAALASALARETNLNDTHPSLKDRLGALGVRPNIPLSFQLSAAHVLLRDKRSQLMSEFDAVWKESIATPWKERHVFLRETGEKLSRYEAIAAAGGRLNGDEQWDYACAVETLRGSRAALVLLDTLLERYPQHAAACYARGRILLEDKQERGVVDVERAMQLDETAREPGSQLLYSFFYGRNQLGRCDKYRHMLSIVARERFLATAERRTFKRRDMLLAHGLSQVQLGRWLAGLSDQPVQRAWLAQRRVRYLQSVPAYVLVVEFSAMKCVTDITLAAVVKALPAGVDCLVLNRSALGCGPRAIRRISGSLILDGRDA